MFGSVVIDSNTPGSTLRFIHGPFSPENCYLRSGAHIGSDYKGIWVTDAFSEREMYLPQRNKHLIVTIEGDHTQEDATNIEHQLQTLDAEYEEIAGVSNYTTKLNFLAKKLNHTIQINNNQDHGFFALVAADVELYLYGIVSTVNNSVQLAWSTLPLEDMLREQFPLQYIIYRFPTLKRRGVFLQTRSIISKWWTLRRYDSPLSLLRAFNALEMKLFKI